MHLLEGDSEGWLLSHIRECFPSLHRASNVIIFRHGRLLCSKSWILPGSIPTHKGSDTLITHHTLGTSIYPTHRTTYFVSPTLLKGTTVNGVYPNATSHSSQMTTASPKHSGLTLTAT